MSDYHDKPEQLTETLSAYLDGALTSAERTALERHLAGCAACQEELAGLRHVGALLRALPEPALPRSFALPEPATRGRRAVGGRRISAWAGAAQWVGGLAAALGAGILILGMLPHIGMGGGASYASGDYPYHTVAGASTSASTRQPAVVSDTPVYSQATGENFATSTASATAPAPTTPSPAPTAAGSSTYGPLEPASSGAPFSPVGAILLIGGGAALAAGTVTRRRSRSTG